ncbi:MAG TPA: dihydrofolate reductase family protein [Gaiellaceae bacterium]|nr:dihydrofolate reductase family protein [Gaiellaceae bacterium]
MSPALARARTIYYGACSLDGRLATADDDLDWLIDYEAPEYQSGEPAPMSEGGGYERFYEGVGALVMGSVTYEWILGHLDVAGAEGLWPYRGKPCWVLSSRELRLPEGAGVDVRIADAPVSELHGEMAAAAGDGVLWVVGGGNVASQFADAGLIDELIITVVPVVLGDGKPVFERPPNASFALLGTRAFANGMVELHYRLVPSGG